MWFTWCWSFPQKNQDISCFHATWNKWVFDVLIKVCCIVFSTLTRRRYIGKHPSRQNNKTTEMFTTKIVECLVCLTAIVRAEVVVTNLYPPPSACTGSLILTSPSSPPRYGATTVFRTGQSWIDNIVDFPKKITITGVEVQGCGCFQIYNKKNGRGKTFILRSNETIKKGDKTFFRYARSMKRVMCSNKHVD